MTTDLEVFRKIKENVTNKEVYSVMHFSRNNLGVGGPGSASAIAYILFATMPSIEELITVSGKGEVILILKGNPNSQEFKEGTEAVTQVQPLGVLVIGYAFTSKEFEEMKEILNIHLITGGS